MKKTHEFLLLDFKGSPDAASSEMRAARRGQGLSAKE